VAWHHWLKIWVLVEAIVSNEILRTGQSHRSCAKVSELPM